jgi:hypothetical protein
MCHRGDFETDQSSFSPRLRRHDVAPQAPKALLAFDKASIAGSKRHSVFLETAPVLMPKSSLQFIQTIGDPEPRECGKGIEATDDQLEAVGR